MRPSRRAPRSMARSDTWVSASTAESSSSSRWARMAVSGFFSSWDSVEMSWLL